MFPSEVRAAQIDRPQAFPCWMGWNAECVRRLLESSPDPKRIGANLAGILSLRLLDGLDAEYHFYLYIHSESHDRYDLAGAWGAPRTGPRAWGSDVREDSISRSVEDATALLAGDDQSHQLFIPLESEDGILGFGVFRIGKEIDFPVVPDVDLDFLGRIGGQAISLLRDAHRADFAQNALASTTRYLERILSLTGDGMLLLDPECRILVANDAVEPLLGRLPIDLTGELLQDALPNETAVSLLTGAHLAASQDVPVTRTLRLVGHGGDRSNGSISRTVEANFERVQVDLEGAPGVLICLRDLEHIAREEWFAKNEKQQGQVVASINRGLLRPVAALRGYLWLLRDELSTKGKANDLMETLELQAEWLQSQLEALALMDEFRTGQTRWRDRLVSPEVLFERAIGRIRSHLRNSAVEIQKSLPEDLPWVRVDVDKWIVVLAFLMERMAQHLGGPGKLIIDEKVRPGDAPLVQLRIRGEAEPQTDSSEDGHPHPHPRPGSSPLSPLSGPSRGNSNNGSPSGNGKSSGKGRRLDNGRAAGVIRYDSGIPDQDFAYGMPLARSIVHHYGGTLLWDFPRDAAPTVHLTIPIQVEQEEPYREGA